MQYVLKNRPRPWDALVCDNLMELEGCVLIQCVVNVQHDPFVWSAPVQDSGLG